MLKVQCRPAKLMMFAIYFQPSVIFNAEANRVDGDTLRVRVNVHTFVKCFYINNGCHLCSVKLYREICVRYSTIKVRQVTSVQFPNRWQHD